jgi:hypothetical protein
VMSTQATSGGDVLPRTARLHAACRAPSGRHPPTNPPNDPESFRCARVVSEYHLSPDRRSWLALVARSGIGTAQAPGFPNPDPGGRSIGRRGCR